MPITAITIENFKGIKDPVRVELKPITLLFGPNSAGKSTIIQALHYAREIFERQNLNPDRTLLGGDTIDLGGFESLVHQHDLILPIRLGFELEVNGNLPDYTEADEELAEIGVQIGDFTDEETEENISFFQSVPRRVKEAKIDIEIRWSNMADRPIVFSYGISINGEELAEIGYSENTRQTSLILLNARNPVFMIEEEKRILEEALSKFEVAKDANQFFEEIGNIGLALRSYRFLDCKKVNPDSFLKDGSSLGTLYQTSALPEWGRTLPLDDSLRHEHSYWSEWGCFVRMLSSLIVGPGTLVRNGLRDLCYIGPLREVPKRNHTPCTSPSESRWADGSAAYDLLFEAEENFISKVNEWLTQEDRLNSGYCVEVKKYHELEINDPLVLTIQQGRILDEEFDWGNSFMELPIKRRLLIRDEARNIELAPQDIGVGLSQVLPVIVAALHRKRGLVVIEQPELHIHPALQVALGDLFIEQVNQSHMDRSRLNFIIETHSEHLLLRLLRRIRETSEDQVPDSHALKPDDLAIYFLEQGEEGIVCHKIRVDEEGDFIDRWPKGFFDERAGELF